MAGLFLQRRALHLKEYPIKGEYYDLKSHEGSPVLFLSVSAKNC